MQDMPYRRPLLSLILSPSRSRYIFGSCKKIRQRSLQPHGRQYFVPIQITESINLTHSGESLQNKNNRKLVQKCSSVKKCILPTTCLIFETFFQELLIHFLKGGNLFCIISTPKICLFASVFKRFKLKFKINDQLYH